MINDMFYDSKKQSLSELLETMNKGIDLLTNNNLDQELCNAFEKYALSTIRMVDSAYMTNYELHFSNTIDSPYGIGGYGNPFGRYTTPIYPMGYQSSPHSASSIGNYFNTSRNKEYQDKIKSILQKLIIVIKGLINE